MENADTIFYNNYVNASSILNTIFGHSNWVISSAMAHSIIFNKVFVDKQVLEFDISDKDFEIQISFTDSIHIKRFLKLTDATPTPEKITLTFKNNIKINASLTNNFTSEVITFNNINMYTAQYVLTCVADKLEQFKGKNDAEGIKFYKTVQQILSNVISKIIKGKEEMIEYKIKLEEKLEYVNYRLKEQDRINAIMLFKPKPQHPFEEPDNDAARILLDMSSCEPSAKRRA
jgi:hypothetical protein